MYIISRHTGYCSDPEEKYEQTKGPYKEKVTDKYVKSTLGFDNDYKLRKKDIKKYIKENYKNERENIANEYCCSDNDWCGFPGKVRLIILTIDSEDSEKEEE